MTLIELIIFIMVVSLGLAGVLTVFNTVVRGSADPLIHKQALAAAEALMEEILLKDFADPDGLAEGNRADFDDVNDYNGYSTTGVYSLADLGAPIAGLTTYNVNVAVVPPAAAIGGVAPAQIRQVSVTVVGNGASVQLVGYRFNYD